MARRRLGRGFSPLRQGQRRQTIWIASADVTAVTAIGGGVIVFDQLFSEAALRTIGASPSTIVRTRGQLWVQSDVSNAQERPFGAMGFSVVSDQAAAVGVTALPAPISNEDSDLFFVYESWQAATVVSDAGFTNPMYQYSFDSRAMRKIEDGDAIVVVLENAALGGIGAQYILKFRMLLKLS